MITLNEKNQCPFCKIKPLRYKTGGAGGSGHYFCYRCDRKYSLKTKEMVESWAWKKDGVNGEFVYFDTVVEIEK
uniref:Uncharacterized protein n=1 Tax=viral metagenome TaxID=1070528 RepID=A0A6M3IK68_9ZZZZ